MTLIERTLNFLKGRRQRILDGSINSIPSNFKRFSNDFIGIEQAKYYLITSSTKGSKTQFASYVFIFNTLLYAYYHSDQCRVKIFYYPLEETPEDVMVRFMCYMLYTLSKGSIRISPTDLSSSNNNKPLSIDIINILESSEYQNIFKFFQENIIFSDSTNPTGVFNECRKYARDNGIEHKKKKNIKDDVTGNLKEVDAFDYYEQNDPDEYRIIFFDHISLTTTERGLTLKQSIDKLSEYFVILRNRYKFSPVVIQQQAFAGESLDAFKENKLRPTIANLADSKYTARDANVILGLFSPFKYELREYLGYDITILRDNIRFLEILVNRGSSPGGIAALYFDGAVNFFEELPSPDSANIQLVYNTLKERRKLNKILFIHSKKLNKKLQSNNIFITFASHLKTLYKIWQKY